MIVAYQSTPVDISKSSVFKLRLRLTSDRLPEPNWYDSRSPSDRAVISFVRVCLK